MKALLILLGGLLAAGAPVSPVLAASNTPQPPAAAPMPVAPVSQIPRTDPFQGLDIKPLRFVADPPNGPEVALKSTTSSRFGNTAPAGPVAVSPPMPIYIFDILKLANGAGLESSSSLGFSYIVTAAGNPLATIGVMLQPNGEARFSMARFTAQNRGNPDDVTTAFTQLPALAAMDKVKEGSYEVRLIRGQPPIALSAIWLKSTVGGEDLIYPVTIRWQNAVEVNHLYTADEFLKVFRPFLRTSMHLPAEQPVWGDAAQMNNYFVTMFKASNNFGASRMPAPEMALNDDMRLNLPTVAQNAAPQSYGIEKMELIGISKHNPPVAFVEKRHEDDSTDFQTRELTDFEKQALVKLGSGDEVVSQPETGGLTVVGAIRAEQSCLQCHPGAKTGDVLGAFSYHLFKISPIPQTPPVPATPPST